MPLQKFSAARVQANATRPQRAQQVAAVLAVCERVLAKAAGTKPKRGRAPGDRFAKIEDFDANSLGAILRARMARGKP